MASAARSTYRGVRAVFGHVAYLMAIVAYHAFGVVSCDFDYCHIVFYHLGEGGRVECDDCSVSLAYPLYVDHLCLLTSDPTLYFLIRFLRFHFYDAPSGVGPMLRRFDFYGDRDYFSVMAYLHRCSLGNAPGVLLVIHSDECAIACKVILVRCDFG